MRQPRWPVHAMLLSVKKAKGRTTGPLAFVLILWCREPGNLTRTTRAYLAYFKDLNMLIAHRIELAPTPSQADDFRRACGTARFVWNWALAE